MGRRVKEKNVRSNKYYNRHGMSAHDIRRSFDKKAAAEKNKKAIIKQKLIRTKTNNGDKIVHGKNKTSQNTEGQLQPSLLTNTPNVAIESHYIYNTPEWFNSTEKADVSIIIPLYKSNLVIRDQINSWITDKNIKIEIIYVDDLCPKNSKDEVIRSWKRNKAKLKNVPVGKIIANRKNAGFGSACNIGAKYATGDYLIFLNADTKVTPNWILPMIEVFKQDNKVAIVGNLHLKEGGMWNGTIDGAGSEWIWNSMCFVHLGRHSFERSLLAKPYSIKTAPTKMLRMGEREMVTGCCFMARADLFREIGGFDQNYRIGYWEDSDLCLTLRELGYKVMFQPQSIIHHKLGHSGAAGHNYQDFNRNYFANKWINSNRIDPLVKDKRKNKSTVRSILIKRQGANGDVLIASSVASALKEKYPGCKITFATDCREVLANNPYIDRVVEDVEKLERTFQVFYNLDMAYEFRPHTNILKAYCYVVGVKPNRCKLYVNCENKFNLPQNYVVMHTGNTKWVGRNWQLDKFNDLAQRIKKLGFPIVRIGKTSDESINCDLNICGKTSVSQLAAVIKEAKLFVGIDSFPMHLAQITETPGVCFFGSIDPKTRIYSPQMTGVTAKDLSCLGCHHRKPTPCTSTSICETGTLDCENLVSADDMWMHIEKKLKL